jgi:amino acid transporter
VCTGLSYAEIGARFPKAAGSAYVIHRAFNRSFLSYIIGLVTAASSLTSIAVGARIIGGYIAGALPFVISIEVLIICYIAVLAWINYRGIRLSMHFNLVCTLIEVSGLILIIAVGLRYWGSVNYLEIPPLPDGSVQDLGIILVLQGAVLTFYSFIGFEDMLNVAEEVKNPKKTFPVAMILALAITTLIYIAVSITAVSVVPYQELAKSTQPLVDVAVRAATWLPPVIFSMISIIAVANTGLLNHITASRILFGMAEQQLLPKHLGKVHNKRRTPHIAILVITLIVLGLALVGNISVLAKATSVLLLSVFVVVNAALLLIKKRDKKPTGHFQVPMFVPFLGILISLALVANARVEEFLVAGVCVAFIICLYLVLKPKKMDEATLSALD